MSGRRARKSKRQVKIGRLRLKMRGYVLKVNAFRVNLGWLFVVTFTTAGLGIILFGIHHSQRRNLCSTLLARADHYEQENDLEKVEEFLRRCLVFDPKHREGQLRYALLRSELTRWQRLNVNDRVDTYVRLIRVSDRFPEKTEVWERIAEIGMSLRRFTDSLEALDKHLLKESPQNLDYLEQKAQCLANLMEYSKVEEVLMQIQQIGPDQLDSYKTIAVLRRDQLKRPDDADQIMSEMVANNPQDPDAYRQRAMWNFRRRNDLAKQVGLGVAVPDGIEEDLNWAIQEDFESALALKPDDSLCIRLYSRYWMGLGEFDKSRAGLQAGLKKDPEDVDLQFELANLEHQAGNRKLGLDRLRGLIASHPDRLEWKCRLAQLGIVGSDEDVLDDAAVTELIRDLRDSAEIPEAQIQFLDACRDWQNKRWGALVTKLESIRQSLNENPAMAQQADYFLAVAYVQLHAPERGLNLFRASLDQDPNLIAAQRGLAGALHSLNRLHEAMDEWRQIVVKPAATTDDWIQLAQCLYDWNLKKSARQRNWSEFDQTLQQIARMDPDSISLARLKLNAARMGHGASPARRPLTTVRQFPPGHPQFFESEFNGRLVQQDWDAAEKVLQAEHQQFGDTVWWRLRQAQLSVARESRAAANERLRELSQPSPAWSIDEQSLLAAGLAELFQKIEAFEEADQLLVRAQLATPDDVELILFRLQLGFESGNLDRVDDLLDQYQQRAGKNALWHLERARRVFLLRNQSLKQQATLDSAALQTAIAELELVDQLRPHWGEAHVLWGDILVLQGDLHGGVSQYLIALHDGYESLAVTTKVIDLAINYTQRYDDADVLLRRHRAFGYPWNEQLLHEEINLAIVLGRKDFALKQLQELPVPVASAATETRFLQPAWRGDCYLSLGENRLAVQQFHQALQVNRNLAVLPSLVTALLNLQQRDQAIQAIKDARETKGIEQSPLILARCYERLQEFVMAEEWYRQAVQLHPEELGNHQGLVSFLIRTNRLDDAEAEIRTILGQTASADPGQQQGAWCRLTLAEILLRQGKKLTEGLAVLGTLDHQPGTPQDALLRLKSKLHERLSSRANLDQAIAILTELESRPLVTAANTEDRWRLAQLCYRVGDVNRGRQVLLAAIGASKMVLRFQPFQIRCLKEYVVKSLKYNELSEAQRHLAFLQQLGPNQPEAKDAELFLLEWQKKYPEIQRCLANFHKKWLNTNDSAVHRITVNTWIAKRYERVGDTLSRNTDTHPLANEFYQTAADLYRENLKSTAAAKWDLASLLVKTDHPEQGLEILVASSSEYPDDPLFKISQNLMSNPRPAAKLAAHRMIAVLSAGVQAKTQKEAIVLKSLSADLMFWIGEDAETEKIYQDLLASNANDYRTMNNYAFFLAVAARDLNLATTLVDKAISIAGPLPELVDTRGYVSLATGDYANALKDFLAEVNMGESPMGYLHLSVAYSNLSQPQLASEAMARANETGLAEIAINSRHEQALKSLSKPHPSESPR
jgi:Tfp pilus assembly protein PilF